MELFGLNINDNNNNGALAVSAPETNEETIETPKEIYFIKINDNNNNDNGIK